MNIIQLLLIAAFSIAIGLWIGTAISHQAAKGSVPGKLIASWYGEGYRGKTMANGQPFDPDKMTCATYLYPLGSVIEVTPTTLSPGHRKSVIVTVTDRGPNIEGRHVDLSRAAFGALCPLERGLMGVRLRLISDRRG